ncbi:MAG: hypothetical protein GY713_00495 [Actinomycetia bacterium]|nr:hypothetical protein [Actinomycetes bacterium]
MSDTDESELVEAALDLFVFAPLGLAIGSSELIPVLAQRGREHVRNAQAVGKLAVNMGQQKLVDAINDPESPVTDILRGLGLLGEHAADPTPEPAPTSGLPIPGYDDHTAAEIVPLLADLDSAGLRAVHDHETANRARKTILNRIRQLNSRSS